MNIVFKGWKTKAAKILISSIGLSIGLALPVSAIECSTLTLPTFEHNNKKHVVLLSAHNGEYQRDLYTPRKVINAGEKIYTLSPGKHTLILNVTPALSRSGLMYAERQLWNRTNIKTLPQILEVKPIIFEIETQANHAYQLLISSTDEQKFKVDISEQLTSCQLEDHVDLQAKSSAENIDELPTLQLPKLMDYRLSQMVTKIATFHLTNNQMITFANFLPTVSYDVFGIVVNNEFENKGTAVKVLSVQPYSIASRLNLLSGDRITHLDKLKVSGAKGHQQSYLKSF